MSTRWRKWLLAVLVALSLAVFVVDRTQIIRWVGHTDLEVEFAVTAAGTGVPVPGARIEIWPEGGWQAINNKPELTLVADADGVARKDCPDSMLAGEESRLRFTNTFGVKLPRWLFRAVADGYEPSQFTELSELGLARQVRRVRPGKNKVTVPVWLRKDGA